MRTKAFQALRPVQDLVSEVASPPYDVVDTEGAALLAAGNPNSFLHVIRPEIDLPANSDSHSSEAYAKAVENFTSLQDNGVLVREEHPSVYVYRQEVDDHQQTGIVTCCHVEDYDTDVIRKHERTLSAKEDDRAKHIETLSANSGPVFITYRDNPTVDSLVGAATDEPALFDFTAPDGVRHIVWRVEVAAEIVTAFESVNPCYIADGHHRSAAAAAVGRSRRAANPDHSGEEEYNWFLATLFPASHLRILPYNRLVRDLNGVDLDDFINRLREDFSVSPTANQTPLEPGSVSMYAGGEWYELTWPVTEGQTFVATLDLSVLQDRLLAPLLGIDNPRTSERIDFVGGIHGTAELVRRVDSGEHAVAFSVHPVTVEQLMGVSDASDIMPPKSTWFEPKLRSGLFVHTL